MAHQLMLFSEGRHANQSVWLDGVEDKMTTGISGERFFDSSPTLDRVFAFLRIHLASCRLPRTTFVRIWSISVTPSGFPYMKLRLSAPRTGDRGCSLWPTPKASDADMGMTARTSGRPLEKSTHLQAQVYCAEMFPTPITRDSRSFKGAARMLNAQETEPLVVQIGGRLNPEWVEWLMGFPIGYTDIGDESQISRETPKELKTA